MHVIMIAMAALQLQTDTTVKVPKDTRLEVTVGSGSIAVTGWNRPDVQITSRTNARTKLVVNLDGGVLRVTSTVRTGVDVADLTLSVPRAMSLKLGTGDVDVTVRNSEGELNIMNYRGLIDVSGGRGAVSLRSTLGEIKLTGARGNVEAETSHESVTITDVVGNVEAKSSSKHITLSDVDGEHVSAESVGGVIRFTGPLHEQGHYSFVTHMGSIFVTSTGAVNATVSVATVSGSFASGLPYKVTNRRRAGIYTAVFGNGKAQIEMESFAGGMILKTNP